MYSTPRGIASAHRRYAVAALIVIALTATDGCKQSPTEPAAVGDTIRIIGSGFGRSDQLPVQWRS